MKIIYDKTFDIINNSGIFEIIPNVFIDDRGYFTEVLRTYPNNKEIPNWLNDQCWIKQINRSCSSGGTVRGCHAQKSSFHCQGKLVEALNEKIYDIITDARPESKTFGTTKVYILDPKKQNKLWVSRGFLHSFAVPKNANNAIFQYFCDNFYNKENEIIVNPMTILPNIASMLKKQNAIEYKDFYDLFDDDLILSEKDKNGIDYNDFMTRIQLVYKTSKFTKNWYQSFIYDD